MSLQESRTRTRVSSRPASDRSALGLVPRSGWLLAALVALARLPYVGSPVSSDEAGFLQIARQWHPGSSLYGGYWVDRPPLLIALYRVGGLGGPGAGGVDGVRLLGCVAAALTVLGVAAALQRVAPRGTGWGAAVVAGLLATPAVGALAVNGELLAAPFVAWGIAAVLAAITLPDGVRARWWALAAGCAAVGALLVKQNMADVAVFGVVAAVLALRGRLLGVRRAVTLAVVALVGAAGTSFLVLGAAYLEGTGPRGLWFAMYPFRVRATAAMAQTPLDERLQRLGHLAWVWALSGALLPVLALVVVLVLGRGNPLQRATGRAVVVLVAYAVLSVAAGGSYWLHYLVQLAVPTALAAGLTAGLVLERERPSDPAAARRWLLAPAVVIVAVSCVTWSGGLIHRADAPGTVVGQAVATAAQPDDTVVSLMGNADVVQASGLRSPYVYLWSLPAHTLDPRLTQLAGLLDGPDAPTWVVERGTGTARYLRHSLAGPALADGYRRVGKVCGRPVLLRDDVVRGPVAATTGPPGCRLPLSPWFANR